MIINLEEINSGSGYISLPMIEKDILDLIYNSIKNSLKELLKKNKLTFNKESDECIID